MAKTTKWLETKQLARDFFRVMLILNAPFAVAALVKYMIG